MMIVVANVHLLNYMLRIIVNRTSQDFSFNHKWKFEAHLLQEGCTLDLNSSITFEFPLGTLCRVSQVSCDLSSVGKRARIQTKFDPKINLDMMNMWCEFGVNPT